MLVGAIVGDASGQPVYSAATTRAFANSSSSQGTSPGTASYAAVDTLLSPTFSPEVLYWEPLIRAWGQVYDIDPNLIATLIQIESCGDPTVSSPAGAQGLFQVMPFHFAPGEDMLDVQTNATRGLNYLSQGLIASSGDAGLALAGYNGGLGIIGRPQSAWPAETQRYYYWGSQIYSEILSGVEQSPTLDEWMDAGGYRLCDRASLSITALEQQARACRHRSAINCEASERAPGLFSYCA